MDETAGSAAALRDKVASLGWWYHNIDLGNGVSTSPDHPDGDYPRNRWEQLVPHLPDVMGKSVLDVGCASGFFSIELKRRGAARVLGVDYAPNHVAQSTFAAQHLGLDIEFRQMDCYDIGQLDETFDIVVFLGVLYHLRHPLLALDLVRDRCREAMLFQTVTWDLSRPVEVPGDIGPEDATKLFMTRGFPAMYLIEDRFNGDPTNWWIINRNGVTGLLRAAGFSAIEETGNPEVFVVYTGDGPSTARPLRGFEADAQHRAGSRLERLARRLRPRTGPRATKGTYTRPVGVPERDR